MGSFYVHLHVLCDGDVMLQRHAAGEIVLGTSARSSLPIPGLGEDTTLLVPERGGYSLRLPHGTNGKIRVGGRILRVEGGLLCDPRPEPLLFADGDRGVLSFVGGYQLRFSVVRRASYRWRPSFDRTLVTALASAACVLLTSAILIRAYGARPTREPTMRVRPAIVDRVLELQKRNRRQKLARAVRKGAEAPKRSAPDRRPRKRARSRHERVRAVARKVAKRVNRLLSTAGSIKAPRLRRAIAAPSGGALDRLLTSSAAPLSVEASLARGLPKIALPRPKVATKVSRPLPVGRPVPSKRAIRRAVARHAGEVRLCYQRALLSHKVPPQGSLLIRWRIDGQGNVAKIRVVKDGVRIPTFTQCITSRLARWSFPPCSGTTCEVIYPFEFFAQT